MVCRFPRRADTRIQTAWSADDPGCSRSRPSYPPTACSGPAEGSKRRVPTPCGMPESANGGFPAVAVDRLDLRSLVEDFEVNLARRLGWQGQAHAVCRDAALQVALLVDGRGALCAGLHDRHAVVQRERGRVLEARADDHRRTSVLDVQAR